MIQPPNPLRTLLTFLWSARKDAPLRICVGLVFMILSKLGVLMVPFFYKDLVNTVTKPGFEWAVFVGLLLSYGSVRLLGVVLSEARDVLFVPVEQRAIRTIALHIFKHLHLLSFHFHLNRKTGSLAQVIERGTRAIEMFFRFFVFGLFPTLLELLLVVVIVAYVYPGFLGVILTMTMAAYIFVTFKISSWRLRVMRSMNSAQNAGGGKAIDSLLNFATVKYFGNSEKEGERYDESLALYERYAIQSKWGLSLLNVSQAVVLTVGLVGIMFVCGEKIAQGLLTPGDFVLITTFLLQVYLPLHALGFTYRETRQSVVDMGDLFHLLHEPLEEGHTQLPPLVFGKGRIVFENVTFGYTPERTILKDISFTVEPLQKVAIVGPSGSGKSTLVSLLLRFFDPVSGEISIDGQNLRNVSRESLIRLIGVVPQDTVLFNDTLFYNIAYGDFSAEPSAVYEASRHAALDSFVKKLPEGYETRVGERGLKLSGGEKQRVAIARAFLKKPKILIFDEATSSLDSHTEKEIQGNLESLAEGRTTLVVAHRLSTVVNADLILVMDQGTLVERGNHGELLAQKGLYAHLWNRQNDGQEILKQVSKE